MFWIWKTYFTIINNVGIKIWEGKAYSGLEYLSGARYSFDKIQNLQGRYVI